MQKEVCNYNRPLVGLWDFAKEDFELYMLWKLLMMLCMVIEKHFLWFVARQH